MDSLGELRRGLMIEGKRSRTVYILDSTALIAGQSDLSKGIFLTSDSVVEELSKDGSARRVLEAVIISGQLSVRTPLKESIERVRSIAKVTGDLNKLSKTDLDILALALEEKDRGNDVVIMSDDYSVQNVAGRINVKFLGMMHPGIKTDVLWTYYCPVCKADYGAEDIGICPKCGSDLKRRPKRTRSRDGSKKI